MSERYPSDPEQLLVYLENARRKRKFFSWLAVIAAIIAVVALILAVSVIVQIHSDQVAGCERGKVAAAQRARVARHLGYVDDARQAEAASRLDCHAAYSVF